MSKFLKILAENNPTDTSKQKFLNDISSVLSHLGFECDKSDNKLTISIPSVEDEEDPTAKVAQAVSILTTADKAFPPTTLTQRLLSPQARRIKSAKDSAMNALVGAVENAAKTIQSSLKATKPSITA